jgi:hypothetical protein
MFLARFQAPTWLLAAGALLLLVACPKPTLTGDNDHHAPGTPDDRAPRVARAPAPVRAKPRTGLPRPRPISTFQKMDWGAFPNDQDKRYGSSGRKIVLRPGKAGVIAGALERAQPGDTILLHGGTYREGTRDDHRALVIEKEGIVLKAMPGQRAKIVPRKDTEPGTVVKRGLFIHASYVMIDGIDLVGFTHDGIGLEKDGGTLKQIIISNVTVKMRGTDEANGISILSDNRGTKRPAIDGLLIRNTSVIDPLLGISCNFGPCRSWWLENVRVKCQQAGGGDMDAIAVAEGDHMVLINVEVSGAKADGIDLKASRSIVMDSHAHNTIRNGIKLWYGGEIVNCLVHHTGADAAVAFKRKGHYRLVNSVVAYHNWEPREKSYTLTAGYDVDVPMTIEIYNTIFYKHYGGFFFGKEQKPTIRNCLFHSIANRSLLHKRIRGESVHEIEITNPSKAEKKLRKLGLGGDNIFADPKFVAPEKGDFHLRADSPAINRGKKLGQGFPLADIEGKPRVQGGTPDLGIYERR